MFFKQCKQNKHFNHKNQYFIIKTNEFKTLFEAQLKPSARAIKRYSRQDVNYASILRMWMQTFIFFTVYTICQRCRYH